MVRFQTPDIANREYKLSHEKTLFQMSTAREKFQRH